MRLRPNWRIYAWTVLLVQATLTTIAAMGVSVCRTRWLERWFSTFQNGCAEDVFKRIDYKTVQVFPEPKTNLLCVDLATGETERFVLFSSTGLLVASGELRPQACLDLKKLGKGDFFVEIPRLKQYLKFTIPESPERINRNRVASAGKR
jgi:hypothetical protein